MSGEWRMTRELAKELDWLVAEEEAGRDPFGIQAKFKKLCAEDKARKKEAKKTQAGKQQSNQALVKPGMSKKAQAIAIWNSLPNQTTTACKAALIEAGFKATTATTYASQVSKWAR